MQSLPAAEIIISNDKSEALLDKAALHFPIRIRTSEPGDAFMPLGMKVTNKISDFLIDEKVPLAEKRRILVVESGEDICWVVGMRIDERFKISDKTRQAYCLRRVDNVPRKR